MYSCIQSLDANGRLSSLFVFTLLTRTVHMHYIRLRRAAREMVVIRLNLYSYCTNKVRVQHAVPYPCRICDMYYSMDITVFSAVMANACGV